MSSWSSPSRRIGFVGASGFDTEELRVALQPDDSVWVPTRRSPPWTSEGADALGGLVTELAGRPLCDGVVVCTWEPTPLLAPAIDIDTEPWEEHVEWAIACWSSALVGAVQWCNDGGSVVAVAELPAALDVSGHLATVVVGEAISALCRSLALGEGARGVRVNVVSTQIVSAPINPMGSPPPLASFPGQADIEVAGAVRMLLDPGSAGVTGTVVRADCGRAW